MQPHSQLSSCALITKNYTELKFNLPCLIFLACILLFLWTICRSLFDISCEKRSSRLKEKKRVGEEVVKSMFASDVIQQNDMIGKLLDNGVARCILVRDLKHYAPHAVTRISEWDIPFKTCKSEEGKQEEVLPESDALESSASERPIDIQVLPSSALVSMASKVSVEHQEDIMIPLELNDNNGTIAGEQGCGGDLVTSALPRDLSTLPCAACGILCYTGMAIFQPSQNAATTFRPLHSYASGEHHRGVCSCDVPMLFVAFGSLLLSCTHQLHTSHSLSFSSYIDFRILYL